MLARIRAFFEDRGVLEVETPVLAASTTTEPHIDSLTVRASGERWFLQASPEHAMKRLVAAGSGPVYQITKAFRDGERGRRHNPEFTILEWYRPGHDLPALMTEVSDLLEEVLGAPRAERFTCEAVFQRYVGRSPHEADGPALAAAAAALSVRVAEPASLDRADWLNVLMERVIEPELGARAPAIVHDFPVCLSTFARIRGGNPPIAERFEAYLRGMELANGYVELTDESELRARFESHNEVRRRLGKPTIEKDGRLLEALESGLPECSGVALGVDRLVMVAAKAERIDEVLGFPVERA